MNLSIYQSPEWEKFKLKTGYTKSFRVNDILILERPLVLGRTMLYTPMATLAQLKDLQVASDKLHDFFKQISKLAKEEKFVFYRLELDIPKLEIENSCLPVGMGKPKILRNFQKSFEEMQPENNWILDITPSTDQLLASMKPKGRYNIKIAQKNNIVFKFLEAKDVELFYDQYKATGLRHKVTYRNKNYFEKLLEILGQKGYARVCATFAKIDGEEKALSSAILLTYDNEVQYLYGASSEDHKNMMAPYLMHWKIIEWAKENDYKKYNFLGVAPDDDPKHPWAGITRFKKQFGGYQYDIAGCYDLVLKPVEYQVFKMAEKYRRH